MTRPRRVLAVCALTLAGAHVLVGIGVSVVDNPEGWFGGILYALMYAVPLVLIARALGSPRRSRRTIAGWVALCLGVVFVLVVVGNWSGYSHLQSVFAVSITTPTAILDLAIFWSTVVLHPR